MSPRISVIGTDYLGATHAACMAELGFEVLGLDIDQNSSCSLTRKFHRLPEGRWFRDFPGIGGLPVFWQAVGGHVASLAFHEADVIKRL